MVKRTNPTRMTMSSIVAILSLVLSVQLALGDTSSNTSTTPPAISDLNIIKNEVSDYADLPTTSSSSVKKQKPMYTTGNELWDNLIRDCLKKPTFSCIQKNVFFYLDTTLNMSDVNVTSNVQLTRNQLEYQIAETPKDEENEIFFEGRAAPIEEVSNALYDKGVKFMVTHNMDVKLPEIMFDGATFRISPRSIEGNGIIAKLEYIPKTEVESRGASDFARLFKKKIKKFFKRKAVLAILAVILVIKVIKIKLFWLLPLLVGVGTAKKLVLKFLLFLFPALAHIFKLCGYYHANHHKTNYHHHKHNINHLHTVLYDGHHGGHDEHEVHPLKEIFHSHSHPPKGHASEYLHGSHSVPPHLSYQPDDDYQFSGPGLGSEYISGIITDRNSNENFKPKFDDAQEIVQWGLTHPFHGVVPPTSHQNAIPPTSHSHNVNPLIHSKHRAKPVYGPPNRNYGASGKSPQQSYGVPQTAHGVPQSAYGLPQTAFGGVQHSQHGRISGQASQHHPQYVNAPTDDNLIKAQRQEAFRIQKEQQLIAKQQSILNLQPFVTDVEPITPKPIDPFYSPILSKLDQTFLQLGYVNEPCRERLVCNMYKFPTKYSPHSNYVSAELSRDSSELQRPVESNPAVMRFYKYIQAARDGQEQRDCVSIYPCNMPTKK